MTIPRKKLRTISANVEKITKPIFGKRGFGEAAIVTDWPHIVGATLARHTMPELISFPRSGRTDGTLKLKIDSSALALELQHLTPQLIDKINTYFGCGAVSRIQIVQGPVPKQPPPDKGPEPIPEGARRKLDQRLAFVSDPNLKAALSALGTQLLKN
ncbi:MAG: hypothetical protein CMM45_08770 [Rhodospirillaceae bacterium]|nr:hypothetical protein [Rhodospirillaceae bacterium]